MNVRGEVNDSFHAGKCGPPIRRWPDRADRYFVAIAGRGAHGAADGPSLQRQRARDMPPHKAVCPCHQDDGSALGQDWYPGFIGYLRSAASNNEARHLALASSPRATTRPTPGRGKVTAASTSGSEQEKDGTAERRKISETSGNEPAGIISRPSQPHVRGRMKFLAVLIVDAFERAGIGNASHGIASASTVRSQFPSR